MKLQRTVHTTATPDGVLDHLSDVTTTNDWDPGTVVTERLAGDGTTYRNVSTFPGQRSELTVTAGFTVKGVARDVTPLLAPALERLGDHAEQGLSEAPSRLAGQP